MQQQCSNRGLEAWSFLQCEQVKLRGSRRRLGRVVWVGGRVSVLLIAAGVAASWLVACQGAIGFGHGRVSGLVGGAPIGPLGNQIGPAPGKTVEFVPDNSDKTQTTTTGSDGRYSIDLTPGDYEVRLAGYAPLQLYYGRDPKTYGQWPKITVTLGQETKLDLIYDTGIR